jgi:formylglycine-generating enzyme required for sulfatase activity
MKLPLAIAIALAATLASLSGQGEPGPTTDSANSTNAPDIKELIQLPSFTNHTGMVMIKMPGNLWVTATELTQLQYQKITGGNPSHFQGERNPVESVSWNEAMAFCAKLTAAEKEKNMLPEGTAYTLPTQSQWESFAAGATLSDAVTSEKGNRSGPAAVGTLGATGLGLFDIRGNVWEWCLDPGDKPFRVARGAAWNSSIEINLRPEFRWYAPPDERKDTVGFRCVLSRTGGG